MAALSYSYVVAVISPERRIQEEIASALEGYPYAEALWALSDYPDARQMAAIKDTQGCVVLLDFSDPFRAKAIAAELDRNYPMAVAVALLPGEGSAGKGWSGPSSDHCASCNLLLSRARWL